MGGLDLVFHGKRVVIIFGESVTEPARELTESGLRVITEQLQAAGAHERDLIGALARLVIGHGLTARVVAQTPGVIEFVVTSSNASQAGG